jgi:hypothetical protein
MKENIEKLQQHYSEFDLIFELVDKYNTEHGKVLQELLSDWYVKGQIIITDMKTSRYSR